MIHDLRICEFFLISGLEANRRPYDLSQVYNQGEEICNANVEIATDFFHYKEPIVDIQIINFNQRERTPEGYHIVDRTYSKQNKADLNGKASVDELYLCFRYGRDQPPITDIWAINPKQKNLGSQESWILIEKTMTGHSANLHSSSTNPLFIAYRRAPVNAPVDNLVVTDICVILTNKNEFCPPAYSRVDVPIKRTPLSHTINVCYKKSIVKQYVLTFQPEIIYCLPSTSTEPIVDVFNADKDMRKKSDRLPEDIRDVANFCMPWGATLESWPSELRTPKPSYVTFVLTNINYDRMYGAAMLFYEIFDKDQLTEGESVKLGLRIEGKSKMNVFASKSICLLSHCPLFPTFKRVLSFLIQEDERQRFGIVHDSCPFNLPLERFISQFLHNVPFPTPQAPNILLQWDLEKPIGIQLPTDAISKFGTSENFYHLVRMLDIEDIIQLFVYTLTEQKILLTSTCNSDLTAIAEALISSIFPFKWSVVYIPFLYLSCIHIIQSPSPYLIGVDSRFFDYFRLPEGVSCVDLINKSIKPPDTTTKYLDHNKVMPKAVLRSLRNGLSNCKVKVTSFEKQQSLRKSTGNLIDDFTILRKKEIIGEATRECFLRAVILMFKNYQKYLIPLSHRQKDEMFDDECFLKSVDKNSRPLYQAIFDTQLWNHFILERSYATEFDDSLAFFDRCIKYLQTMDEEQANVSSLLQTDSVIKSEHTKVVPPPDPVEGWVVDTSRTTFPQSLDSGLMLPSPHLSTEVQPNNILATPNDGVLSDLHQCQGSMASLTSPDSSIPVLHIRVDSVFSTGPTNRLRRTPKISVLKRPFEELKQARHLGKEANRNSNEAWAGHLLTSSYCLWYISLPGLIGYVLDTPGLRESGLSDRILELAVEMLDSINNYRLFLPDEVCFRVLLLLVHQLHPPRLHVSDIRKHADLNAFSYGLYNQILLEEETQLTEMANMEPKQDHVDKEVIVVEKVSSGKGDFKEEKDCDSGRETLSSYNNVSPGQLEDASNVTSSFNKQTPVSDSKSPRGPHNLGIDNKVRLRGRLKGPQKYTDRMSQLLFQSPMDLCASDVDRSHQFFDESAGIIMSSTPRNHKVTDSSPILVMHKSPSIAKGKERNEEVINHTESVVPAIILRCPFSEEKSELHASYMTKKRISHESSNDDSSEIISTTTTPSATTKDLRESSISHNSSLTQIKGGIVPTNVSNRTRTSFRQLKSAANKSLKSMRSMMTSMGSGSWLQPVDSHLPSTQEHNQYGMPATFKPWEQQNNIHSNRLKTTASADLLNTINDDETEKTHASRRPCAGTVQQLRRHHNLDNGVYPNADSIESFHSDPKMDQYSSTNSLESESPIIYVDKIWEKITDSLAAVQLPTGKYWQEEDFIENGQSSPPSIECSQSLVLKMTSCSDCASCHSLVYDDDIMSGWSYDDSDLQSLCYYCDNRFSPKLTFQVFIDQNMEMDQSKGRSNRSTLAYKSEINYLSPFVLRKELESVLQQEGEVALLRPNFLKEHSILYWNLVWFYSRLSLPTHMLSFLTLWLRDKGRDLVEMNEDNKDKYEILTSLTGHEQVSVVLAWELNQLMGRQGLPLYRKYIATSISVSNEVGGIVGPINSPSRTSLNHVVTSLFNSDIRQAIYLVLNMRSNVQMSENGGAVVSPVSRSAYREIMYLAIVALQRYGLNLDMYHHMYHVSWCRIIRANPELASPYDKPPSNTSYYCRKVFRPLILI